ncbi:MAG TPA: YdcF family protein [Longimicrobiales bacterium]|nr:YdcF family protein [Longimicrobiales bacterium]
MSSLSRTVRFTTGVLAAILLLWGMSIAVVLLAGAWPNTRSADAIVVLGAAQYNGRPSPVLQARLDHALDLYDRGLAAHMIFTGGTGVGDTVSEAEVSRRYAMEKGVPSSAIMTERDGLTSAQSVRAAAALMKSAGLESALLVSDSYHMMRLEVLARRSHIVPYRAPAADGPIDQASRRTRMEYVLRESLLFPATTVFGGR